MRPDFIEHGNKKGSMLNGRIEFKPNERSVILSHKRKPENQIKDINRIKEFARRQGV